MATAPTVTTHEIEYNGQTFIVEWTHTDDDADHIALTATCGDQYFDADGEIVDCEADHDTYDFKQITE